MRGVAAGEFLERDPRVEQDPRAIKRVDGDLRIGGRHAVRGVEPRFGLKRVRRCREPALRQSHRFEGVARSESGVKRLGHGAEIAPQTAGHRGGDPEGRAGLGNVKPKRLGQRAQGTEGPQGARTVKTALVVTNRNALGDSGADFDPNHVGLDEIAARHASARQIRHQRGDDDGAWVCRHHGEHVVEIERMPEGTVDERGHRRAGGARRSQDRSDAPFIGAIEIGEQWLLDFASDARQDDGEGVGDDLQGLRDRALREFLQTALDDEARQTFG